MPADNLSREEIERVQENLDTLGFVDLDDATMLLQATLTEPARLASARAEGVREGIERCATRLEEKAAAFLKERDRHMRAWNETEGTPAEKVHSRRACSDEATAASLSDWAAELRALPPPPAEPTGMTADGWIEWKGGECPVAPKTTVEPRYRNGESDDAGQAYRYQWDHWPTPRNEWDIVAYRIVKPAEPSAPVAPDTYETPPHGWTCFHCGETFKQERQARWHFGATATAKPGCMLRVDPIEERGFLKLFRQEEERAAALEAENAKLREGLKPFSDAADGFDGPSGKRGVPDAFHILRGLDVGDLRRARALLQGGPDGRPAPAGVAQNATTLAPWCETCQTILDAIAAAREEQVALAHRLSDRSTDLRARGDADEGARAERDAEEHRMAAVTIGVLFDRCNAIVFGGGPDAG